MKKIIQLVSSGTDENHTLMCLTEDGKVYERITRYQRSDGSGSYFVYHSFWKEVPEVKTDDGFDLSKL